MKKFILLSMIGLVALFPILRDDNNKNNDYTDKITIPDQIYLTPEIKIHLPAIDNYQEVITDMNEAEDDNQIIELEQEIPENQEIPLVEDNADNYEKFLKDTLEDTLEDVINIDGLSCDEILSGNYGQLH